MGDAKGFLKVKRQTGGYRSINDRLRDYREVEERLPQDKVQEQGSRCMDCGVPFCHYACPLGNVVPDWNDLMFRGQWAKAVEVLHASNNFPEFTGRVCPALCEAACVLGINDDPVTVRQNEIAIVEWGFEHGAIKPFIPSHKTGKKVAVVGSGPAGMAVAQQLTRAGHEVVLFEADDRAGGILRYGIPDFKLEEWVIDRRLEQMRQEGLVIKTGVCVGRDVPADRLIKEFDAVCLTMGSRQPRDLKVEGRELAGIHTPRPGNRALQGADEIWPLGHSAQGTPGFSPGGLHFAMDYLKQSNQVIAGVPVAAKDLISAKGKHVVVIGGGDTGADCVGTANRQGAASVTQIEILPKPPLCRTKEMPWPTYPAILKTSSSHEEGCLRKWSVATKKFSGSEGRIEKIHGIEADSDFELKADLVILAMGFVHPVHNSLIQDLGLSGTTSNPKVFAAGDASRGASFVIWAIYEGRSAAREIDRFLMGATDLS